MKIPKKPSGRKRSPFYWWRRFKSHKYLPHNASLLVGGIFFIVIEYLLNQIGMTIIPWK